MAGCKTNLGGMRIRICLLALLPLGLVGCVVEDRVPTATTTTVTREVTTTGPATAPTRQVLVTQAPPAVRVERQAVSPGPGYVWTRGHWRWVGDRYDWVSGTWVS